MIAVPVVVERSRGGGNGWHVQAGNRCEWFVATRETTAIERVILMLDDGMLAPENLATMRAALAKGLRKHRRVAMTVYAREVPGNA